MTGRRRLANVVRSEEPADARLDDLLSFAEPPASPPIRREPWVLKAVVNTLIASVLVYMAFLVANLAPPYLLILVICGSAMLVRRAIQVTAEPQPNRTTEVMRPRSRRWTAEGAGWLFDGDGVRDAVRRWDRRLEWGTTGPERYRASVAGRLAELASERLRQRHGFTAEQDPQRAREVLGEATWRLIYGPGDLAPSQRELSAAIQRLESL